jgi:hypothetical protein
MAGRMRGARGLFLCLLLAACGSAVFAAGSSAAPLGEGGTTTAQAAPPARQSTITLAAVSCRKHERWSPKRGVCLCAKGLKREGSKCVDAAPVTPPVAPPTDRAEEAKKQQAVAIENVQRCFAALGYYKGPIDGKANEETWTAHWNFKNEHGLKAYGDFLAEPVRQKLSELCKELEQQQTAAVGSPPGDQPQAATATTAAPVGEVASPPELYGGLDIECLPDNLLTVLRRAHGLSVRARVCDDNCLPTPRGLGPAQLEELTTRNGLSWCNVCVPIKGHLALEDVRRIERAGNLKLCATPPLQLSRRGSGIAFGVRSYTRIRELYRALPPVAEEEAAIAVVIGNRNYARLPASETSLNDAGAMYSFLTEHLGYRQDNVIDLRDATKADLDRLFGATADGEGELARLFRSKPNAKIVVYFSGLGSTDAALKENYLLPVDAEPYREERTGYALSKLYTNLSRLSAKSVLLLLEVEYGRDHSSYVLPPNLPEQMNSALPVTPLPTLTVLSASDRGQRTLIDADYDVGLFTRYLVEGLAGSADLHPIGNGDGKIDSAEIYVYTAAMVELAARKTFGLLQNPVYSSPETAVVGNAGTIAEK